MKKFYIKLFTMALVFLSISFFVIYYTIDLKALQYIHYFKFSSLIFILILMAIGLYFDGKRLLHLVEIADEKINIRQALQVIFSNYCFALLTPGASGGAVAQVMFLRKAGVPTGKATVIVLVRTVLSILFLFVCLPFILYYDSDLLPWLPQETLIILAVTVLVGSVCAVYLFRTTIPLKLLRSVARRFSGQKRRAIFRFYRDMNAMSAMLLKKPRSIALVFFESAISLLFLYAIVPCMFWGIGVGFDWLLVMGRMIFLNIILYFAPTPGGAGVAEGGFILLFESLVPRGMVGLLAVVWRFFAEYLLFFIGLYYTIKVFGGIPNFREADVDKRR